MPVPKIVKKNNLMFQFEQIINLTDSEIYVFHTDILAVGIIERLKSPQDMLQRAFETQYSIPL